MLNHLVNALVVIGEDGSVAEFIKLCLELFDDRLSCWSQHHYSNVTIL